MVPSVRISTLSEAARRFLYLVLPLRGDGACARGHLFFFTCNVSMRAPRQCQRIASLSHSARAHPTSCALTYSDSTSSRICIFGFRPGRTARRILPRSATAQGPKRHSSPGAAPRLSAPAPSVVQDNLSALHRRISATALHRTISTLSTFCGERGIGAALSPKPGSKARISTTSSQHVPRK